MSRRCSSDAILAAVNPVDFANSLRRAETLTTRFGWNEESRTRLIDWLAKDHYQSERAQLLEQLEVAANDDDVAAELHEAFAAVLPIGTGGRRGKVAPGPNRINAVTIRESVFGLFSAMQLWGAQPRVIIGYDTRRDSRRFAHLSARMLGMLGVDVRLLDAPRSTPQIALLLRELECGAGIVISASHNPAGDNGIKMYGPDGAQVLGSRDRQLTDAIESSGSKAPLCDAELFEDAPIGVARLDLDVMDQIYTEYVLAQGVTSTSLERAGTVVYTPLQGVGEVAISAVLTRRGAKLECVTTQCDAQGGSFAAVSSANPENIAAFDRAIELGEKLGARLLIANDPDADRLGACYFSDRVQRFLFLDGNQLGALLLDHVCRHQKPATDGEKGLVATTLVTTPLVAKIGRAYGADVVDDLLVGFKHHAALVEEREGQPLWFACEESHGYSRGRGIRDKDGATAALLLVELVADLARQGQSIDDRLNELWVRFGYHREKTRNLWMPGLDGAAAIARIMQAWRVSPPSELAEFRVPAIQDRLHPRNTGSNARDQLGNVVEAALVRPDSTHARLVLRPSGTEPKLKIYVLMSAEVQSSVQLEPTMKRVDRVADELADAAIALAHHYAADVV